MLPTPARAVTPDEFDAELEALSDRMLGWISELKGKLPDAKDHSAMEMQAELNAFFARHGLHPQISILRMLAAPD